MKTTDRFIAELTREGATTRRALERVPEDKLSWTPHPKSLSLGQLALHVASLPGAIAELLSEPVREVANVPRPEAKSRDELLSKLDESVARATATLAAWSEEDLMEEWRLTRGGETILAVPRLDAVRTVMFNHSYHHRGQLQVYLRLLDVPVPSVYGPSADENPLG